MYSFVHNVKTITKRLAKIIGWFTVIIVTLTTTRKVCNAIYKFNLNKVGDLVQTKMPQRFIRGILTFMKITINLLQ